MGGLKACARADLLIVQRTLGLRSLAAGQKGVVTAAAIHVIPPRVIRRCRPPTPRCPPATRPTAGRRSRAWKRRGAV